VDDKLLDDEVMEDEVTQEIRRHRAEFAARFDHDIGRMLAYIRERVRQSGRPTVRGEPRRVQPIRPATKSLRRTDETSVPAMP
jgi:hypothetical protein